MFLLTKLYWMAGKSAILNLLHSMIWTSFSKVTQTLPLSIINVIFTNKVLLTLYQARGAFWPAAKNNFFPTKPIKLQLLVRSYLLPRIILQKNHSCHYSHFEIIKSFLGVGSVFEKVEKEDTCYLKVIQKFFCWGITTSEIKLTSSFSSRY